MRIALGSLSAACLTLAAVPGFAGIFDNAILKGVTDKTGFYAVNDTATFTLHIENAATNELPANTYFVRWTRTGDDGVKTVETVPLSLTEPVTVATSLAKAGFVHLEARVVSISGNVTNDIKRTTDSQNVAFEGGTGFSPEQLQGLAEPADFDSFWTSQKARLAAVAMTATRQAKTYADTGINLYALSVTCAGPRPVTGYLAIPTTATAANPLRAILHLDAYGETIQTPDASYLHDAITLHINAHGYELGRENAYYQTFYKSIKPNGQIYYGFDPVQNADPTNAYFNGMVLRVLRALQYLKSLPEWNKKDLRVEGVSQGGLQTIWAAGLDPDVTVANVEVPWGCDWGGKTLDPARIVSDFRPTWVSALGYYDTVSFGKRISASCSVEIARAGLGDCTSPPSGVALLYKSINAKKTITWVQGATHGYVPPAPKQTFTLSADAPTLSGIFDSAVLKGVTDKTGFYAVDGTASFTLHLENTASNAVLPANTYFIKWTRTGDDGLKETETVPLSLTEPLTVTTTLSKPGFVRLDAQVVSIAGNVTNSVKRTTDNQKVAFAGGAGFSPERLQGLAEPADFDSFWASQKARLAAVPLTATRQPTNCTDTGINLYALSVACAGPRPVTGYLAIPTTATAEKPLGAFLCFSESRAQKPADSYSHYVVTLCINAHGYELGREASYYTDFENSIKSHGYSYGFDPVQNADPTNAYFNGMVLRALRALQYLKSLPEWNKKDLSVQGFSQDGLQAIWVAGLDTGVTDASIGVPWCCDLGGIALDSARIVSDSRPAWVPALGYYDAVNFGKRIPASCFVTIARAALGDDTAPPLGVALLYKNIKAPKAITWVQGATHGNIPPAPRQQFTLTEKAWVPKGTLVCWGSFGQ